MPRKVRRPKESSDSFDIESELLRIYNMIMEDLELIRKKEREGDNIVVNKYLYYDQANRILGQIILLRYKYEADVENPWAEIHKLIKGVKGGKEEEESREAGMGEG